MVGVKLSLRRMLGNASEKNSRPPPQSAAVLRHHAIALPICLWGHDEAELSLLVAHMEKVR